MKRLIFSGKVFLWAGDSPWHFVSVDKRQSEKLRSLPAKKKRGFNSVKVRAKIGKTSWDTSLFPTKDGPYLLAIKKKVRYEEGVETGDTVRVSCILL